MPEPVEALIAEGREAVKWRRLTPAAELLDLIRRLCDALEARAPDDAIHVEFPSGNWFATLDREVGPVVIRLWNEYADENQRMIV